MARGSLVDSANVHISLVEHMVAVLRVFSAFEGSMEVYLLLYGRVSDWACTHRGGLPEPAVDVEISHFWLLEEARLRRVVDCMVSKVY